MLSQDIDKKILRIQESTRASLPFFIPLHNTLRLKFKWYYNWHLLRGANVLHFLFLTLFTAGMFFTVYNSSVPKSNASTSDTKVVDTYAQWGQGSADSNIDIETAQGSVKLRQQIGTNATWTNETDGPGSIALAANNLGVARDTSALATDGEDIYSFGGLDYPTFLKDCYKYDVSEDSWTKLADMPGTLGMGAAEYANGKFYVFSGNDDGNYYDYIAYKYDPLLNSWETINAAPNYRESPAAELRSDGKIYLFGGSSIPCLQNEECLNTNMQIDVYNPQANSWSTLTSTNKTLSGVGIAYGDDLYNVGGQTMVGAVNKITKYNFGTNTWEQVATLVRARAAAEVAVLENKIYIFGGVDGLGNDIGGYEIYNPADNSVTLKTVSNFNRFGNRINNAVVGKNAYHYAGDGEGPSSAMITFPNNFAVISPGIHTSAAAQLDAGAHDSVSWTTFVPTADIPANTSVSFKFRTSANSTDWSTWSASTPYAASIDLSGLTQQRYLQVESTLANTNAAATPTLNNYTANFSFDDIPDPSCSDGIQNQDETGVDCGGSCEACPVPPSCSDSIQNQNETGVDCGGVCPACSVSPTCSDGIQNQAEEDVDCGGPCDACIVEPTCSDGVQNGSETGIDCGGSCEACAEPKLCQNNELQECKIAAFNKHQQCLKDAGGDPVKVQACYSLPCAEDDNCLAQCGLPGIDVFDDIHVIVPNGEEQYKLTEQMEIKWDYYRLRQKVVKDIYAVKFSLSTDSGKSFKEIKTLLPKGKQTSWISNGTTYDYYVAKNKNGTNVDINAWPEVTEGYLSYTWEIPSDTTLISDQVRVKLEPIGSCSAGEGDISDRDFRISQDAKTIILNLTVSPLIARVKSNEDGDFTVTAKLSDGQDVTSATTFGFNVSNKGEITSQDGNTVKIKAGKDTGLFNNAITITGTYQNLVAQASASLEIYSDTVPGECVGICFKEKIENIVAEIKGSNAVSVASLAVAALLALGIGLLNIAGNVASALKGADVFSFFIKGMSKKDARGTVYDAMTGIAIPYATIILTDSKTKQSSFAISDKNGQFSISVSPEQHYEAKAEKLSYSLFKGYNSTKVKKFELKYTHNYFGGDISIPKDTYLFDYNLPMIPTETDSTAKRVNLFASLGKALTALNYLIILVGLAFSFYAIYFSPTLYNWMIFVLYVALIIYLIIKYLFLNGHNYGEIVDASGKPVELALVRAVRVKTGKLVTTIATDKKGKFGMALPIGVYHIYANKAGMMQTNEVDAIISSSFRPARVKVKMDQYSNDTIKPDSKTEVITENQRKAAKGMQSGPSNSVNSADEIIEKYGS